MSLSWIVRNSRSMTRLNSGCVAAVSEPRGAENRAMAAEVPMGEKNGQQACTSMTGWGESERARGNAGMVFSLFRLVTCLAGVMWAIEAAAEKEEEEEEEEEEDDDFDDDRNLAVFATKCLMCLP